MIVEPNEKQAKLSIWGWGGMTEENPKGNWVIYHIDLADKLRPCTDSDFEKLSAHCNEKSLGGTSNDVCCRLGEKMTYNARKPDSYCIHGKPWHDMKHESCPCTLDDLSCDFGYKRERVNDFTSFCVPDDKHNKIDSYDICYGSPNNDGAKMGHHIPSTVYRQVPGDKCSWEQSALKKDDFIKKQIETVFKLCKPETITDVAVEDDDNCLERNKNGSCTKYKTIYDKEKEAEFYDDYSQSYL